MNDLKKKPIYSYSKLDELKILFSNLLWTVIDILSCKTPKIGIIYDKFIKKEYLREIKLFELSRSKKILHIGCGPYPITSIMLSDISNGKIVGIDKNPNVTNWAKKMIYKKNLGERINIKCGDGINFPLEGFDTIIISSCSIPKYKIIEHLFENAPCNCKIVVREQPGPDKLVLGYINLYKDKIECIKKINTSAYPTAKF